MRGKLHNKTWKCIALALLTSPAVATADPYIECIQSQLTDQSIDVGDIDGQLGAKTRSGLSVLKDRHKGLAALPALTRENGSVWCKAIGQLLDLRQAWPSENAPVRLLTGKQVSDGKRRLLQREIENARRALTTGLNVELPGPVIVVAASTMDETVRLALPELNTRDTANSVRRQMTAQCRGRNGLSGAAYGGLVVLCPNTRFTANDTLTPADSRHLPRLITHEVSHEIQTQLVGNYRFSSAKERVRRRGPKWLTEGTAIALELDIVVKGLSVNDQVQWFKARQSYSGNQLRKLTAQDTRVDRNFQLYAGFAGVLLASKHSHSAFTTFWEETPLVGWEKAFEIAFGQTVDDFYSEFGTD